MSFAEQEGVECAYVYQVATPQTAEAAAQDATLDAAAVAARAAAARLREAAVARQVASRAEQRGLTPEARREANLARKISTHNYPRN